MPRLKKATDSSGTVFYPITISKGVWDNDNNQRLSTTLASKADLVNGKVPAAQLPSYVDDVIEGYLKAADGKFYATKSNDTYSSEITGETGKIYVDLDEDKSYRWSGSTYIEIASSPASTVSVKIGSDNTEYSPNNGVITLPAYPTDTDTTYKFTIGSTTLGDSSGTSLGTLESKSAATGGTDLSLVTTGEKATWNGKQDALEFNTAYNASSNKAATMSDIPSSLPANGGNAATVNSCTVLSDVPANAVFTDTTYSVMGASGSGHASGLTPDTPSTAGTNKFLREDGTWVVPNYPNVGLPVGAGTVTSLASLPVTNRMIVATISANQASVSIESIDEVPQLPVGCELHVVVKATAAVTITLPTSSPYINMNADTTLSLAANSYAEINFISDGTNIYVRAIA